MLDIYVCEDIAGQRQRIVQMIQNAVLIEELDMQLAFETDDPYALLKKLEAGRNTGIYFLDIDLHDSLNGLKLARQIRQLDPRGFIVFITVHSEMSYMTFQYRVEALDFILKDNPAEVEPKIRECLHSALERYSLQTCRTPRVYTLETCGRKLSFAYEDILFFETASQVHKIILHARERQLVFSGTLKELAGTLSDDFVRCHRSFLVNRKNIREIDRKNRLIHFSNGETCLLSARMIKNF